jgi:hypothetical protein
VSTSLLQDEFWNQWDGTPIRVQDIREHPGSPDWEIWEDKHASRD